MVISPCQALNSENMFQEACAIERLNSKQMFFLFHLLDLKLFSQTVLLDMENITEFLEEAHAVQNLCRRLVPFIQYYMYYRPEFKSVYDDLCQNGIDTKLAALKFCSVQTLQNVYRSRYDASVCISVSNKTCLDIDNGSSCWKYLCRADTLENEKDVLKGFVKLFARSERVGEAAEKNLLTFCLLMNQLIGSKTQRLREEDRRELEKDYGIKFWLPSSQITWAIPEATDLSGIGTTAQEVAQQAALDSQTVARDR